MKKAYSFDDILLIPQCSDIKSRREVSLETKISRTITLKMPIIATFMDTVCEAPMAIALARLGGLGILHRWNTVDQQVAEVIKVKRAENIVIQNPYTLPPDATLEQILGIMRQHRVGGILIIDKEQKLLGIVTSRDIDFEKDPNMKARELMTPRSQLIVSEPGITSEEAIALFRKYKIEKLPLIDPKTDKLCGLMSKKDSQARSQNSLAVRDSAGHLLVAASVGTREKNFLERTGALLAAGANLIVLAVANGYMTECHRAVREIRKNFPDVDLLAGGIANYQGAEDLFVAGADGVLVGIGPGSSCKTRIVTGFGVPQFSAIMWAAEAARKYGKTVLGDGGIRYPGDVVKALAAGSSAVLLGGLLAGTDEAPGDKVKVRGNFVKRHRGLSSTDAREKLQHILGNSNGETPGDEEFYNYIESEGVEEAYVPYVGSAKNVIKSLIGGLRSGMSYAGARTIPELWKLTEQGKFVEITQAGQKESAPHDL
ncbi:MAG: IMP dehydrogenase, partial [Patescibacteria group bacterium]